MLSKINYANQFRETGRVIRNTTLFGLLCVCSAASAWGQVDCNPRQASCSPGQYVDTSGDRAACRPCTGNTYSDGCTRSCETKCPQGTVASANHQCLPTCQATVTGPQLKADSGGSGPLHVVSFSGNVTNPPQPVNNGMDWYPGGGTANLVTFSTQSGCEDYWTWKAESTTGTWKDNAAECKYKLEKGQKSPNGACTDGYEGQFTIVCSGNSCKY